MGPFLVAIGSQLTRNPRAGVLSLAILFATGAVLLLRVKEEVSPVE
jgi:MFS-type transporter involved in bile tolerance (Atg22 family)